MCVCVCVCVQSHSQKGHYIDENVYVACINIQNQGAWGDAPQENLDASEAILGQKQSHSSYMAHKVLHPIIGCNMVYAFAKLADIEFPREKAEQQVG